MFISRAPKLPVRFILLAFLVSFAASLGAASDNAASAPTPKPAAAPIPFRVDFGDGANNTIVIEQNGKRYELDMIARTVRELPDMSSSKDIQVAQDQSTSPQPQATIQAAQQDAQTDKYYRPGDDRLMTIPSGQRIGRHAFWVNFSHRFPYSPPFNSPALGHTFFGMDDFALPSFGFQYGITDRLSVAIYRSPSLLGRPIELRAAYRLLDEHDHQPFNATFRYSIDGLNSFTRDYTSNFELIASKSITHRALFVLVPTVSIHNRPALGLFNTIRTAPFKQPCEQALATGVPASMHVKPCANTMSLGVGLSVDVRPTVALIAEVTPTLVNARDLGIHRPPFGFAIQKKIWRHAFTFGLTTAPGTTVSQRSQTRAIYFRDPRADRFSQLTIGFNLSRQLR
jgi:hypothetical protein